MSGALEFLERSKIEELEGELQAKGFHVIVPERAPDRPNFDLVAEKGGRRIAYEVKAQPALRASLDQIAVLRNRARAEGYEEFRLVVVPPPRETHVHIPELKDILLRFVRDHRPEELRALSEPATPWGIGQVLIDVVELKDGFVHIGGGAVLAVKLGPNPPADPEQAWWADFPMRFDVALDAVGLNLDEEKSSISVDTSSGI